MRTPPRACSLTSSDAPLLHAIAPIEHSDAPAALRALAGMGVPLDRRIEGKLAIERATEAGAIENLRALEDLGARPPPRPAPPKQRASKAPTRPRRRGAEARPAPSIGASEDWPELAPAKRWWHEPVRLRHLLALVGVVSSVSTGIAFSRTFATLVGYALLILLGIAGLWVKTTTWSHERPRRGRRGRDD